MYTLQQQPASLQGNCGDEAPPFQIPSDQVPMRPLLPQQCMFFADNGLMGFSGQMVLDRPLEEQNRLLWEDLLGQWRQSRALHVEVHAARQRLPGV